MKLNIVKIKKVLSLLIVIPFLSLVFYVLLHEISKDYIEMSAWLVAIVLVALFAGIYRCIIWAIQTLVELF